MAYKSITVPGLSDDEGRMVNLLLEQLQQKAPRNHKRSAYYEARNSVRQVAKVLPPAYQGLATCLGWSGKAVDMLARRTNLSKFDAASNDLKALGIDELLTANAFKSEFNQAVTSSLIHATAFITTTVGEQGEPKSLIHFFDALEATGLWDKRTRRLSAGIVLDEWDANEKRADAFTLHLPGEIISCSREGSTWTVERSQHAYGMTMDAMRYRPRLGRQFGASRITRPMMSIQDSAVRGLLRLEGHMDTYSFPEMWMLGADLRVFGANADAFAVRMGRLKGIPDDEKATNPRVDVKQFAASDPQPHLAALNAYAKLFAREADLPDTSLAITDLANPTSAEAYDSAQYELIAAAESAADDFTPDVTRAVARALAIQNDDPNLAGVLEADMTPRWRPAQYQSHAAEADAGLKQLQAVPWLSETEVGLELLGLDESQINRALADKDRAQAASVALQVVSAARGAGQGLIAQESQGGNA